MPENATPYDDAIAIGGGPDGYVAASRIGQLGLRTLGVGVTVIGQEASDVISEAIAIIEFAGSAEYLGLIVHPHPTLPESLMEEPLRRSCPHREPQA